MTTHSRSQSQQPTASLISRRQFLRAAGTLTVGLLAARCLPASNIPASSTLPTPAASTPSAVLSHQVAIARATSYERKLVHQQVQNLLEGLGDVKDLVSSGARVAIKVNLTGGSYFKPPPGVTAVESYITHPEVVRALGELLRDAGAQKIYLVEALYDQESAIEWGYVEIAKSLEATTIDLSTPTPYKDFVSIPVGKDWLIYDNFTVNPILQDIDVFVSVAKMKCHYSAGVTLSMKNLVGLVPATPYRLNSTDTWRSAFHGTNDTATRLPRVIVDLNRGAPIHLALIDGIKTAEGGEVPRGSFAPVAPGVLVAGKNALATDAVATAAMGFDPRAASLAAPFLHSDNYLNLAYEAGLGTNHLEEIKIVGESIESVRFPFKPSTSEGG